MNVKKFFATTSREALKSVKNELGAEAIILSNRAVNGGVEIIALPQEDMSSLISDSPAIPPVKQKNSGVFSEAPAVFRPNAARWGSFHTQEKNNPGSENQAKPISDAFASGVMTEIKVMRNLIEEQLAGLVWGEAIQHQPIKSKIMRHLFEAGFSAQLVRQIVEHLPNHLNVVQSYKWVQSVLNNNLHTVEADDIVSKGGVYALIGPTGVGKTTTVAKIAARCIVRHGASKLALLTTDSYRIGAQEQLRTYGKLLGVPVHTVKDKAELERTLSELKNKHMILIDTVGMSQRDQMVAEQAVMLNSKTVNRLLLLAAPNQGNTLDEVVRVYQVGGVSGCIITKLDEAVSIGAVIDVVIRNKLMLHFVGTGQRVPEDLNPANRDYLIHRALKISRAATPFSLQDSEYPLVMLNAVTGGSRHV